LFSYPNPEARPARFEEIDGPGNGGYNDLKHIDREKVVPQELKATLNLPKTSFPMKANLPQNEPKMLARWAEMRIYDRLREVRAGAPLYVLHDGPPYANGPIHLGHALNKSLKDFVVKSRNMSGFDAPYIPGWDCHGLPIEIKVDEALGGKKLSMNPLEVRRACREYATKYLDLQREQFKRIGIFGRFDHPYSTMTPEYESVVVDTLFRFFERGAVYKGLRPVYWCIHDKTALAEAEVEYANRTSPSIWVKYRLTSNPAEIDPQLEGKKVSTIIWTTTPWTLPASMAVAFHPEEQYVALESGGQVYIVAERLAAATAERCGVGGEEIARFPGRKLEYATFAHPFLDRQILGVLADYVTMDQGTGAVHTAPAHGADDFRTGTKYKLPLNSNVDEEGRLRNGLSQYDGMQVFEANRAIVNLLEIRGVLLAHDKLEHSYPHCWRCHNPVIFRATEQWFISMEANVDGDTLRSRALSEIRQTKWDPAWGEERISNMIATRPDWCISRQRVWGVPIAVFFCEACNQILQQPEVFDAVRKLFATEGADAWYARTAEQILPTGVKCEHCGEARFRKEMDIIDVWFESGSSSMAVLTEPGLRWPADMYLEGGDQHRGWFHSSLLCAIGARGSRPYQEVLTNGWTLDEQGRAMSKSLGNVVDPVDIANRMGAEIVRLWVASVDFREDVHASENLMQRVADTYRKIRNTFRGMLQNLYDFDPRQNAVPFSQMEPLDRYMLLRTADLAQQVRQWYEQYQFHRVYQQANQFCVVDVSALYLDVTRDTLYTHAPESRERRSAQTALWHICEALVRLLAPIMSFTADEIWQHLPAMAGRPESVHLALFPEEAHLLGDAPAEELTLLRQEWQSIMAVRDEVLKAIETAKQQNIIVDRAEAAVTLTAAEGLYHLLQKHQEHLRALFIVSGVALQASPSGNGSGGIRVKIEKAAGQKCERCWNYSVRVGEDANYPTVCERCSAALAEIKA
jgi:isoleucyl-tRNA synthetase